MVMRLSPPQVASTAGIANALVGIGQQRRADRREDELVQGALESDEGFLRFASVKPQSAQVFADMIQNGQAQEIERARQQAERIAKESALLLEAPNRQEAIMQMAQKAHGAGEPVDRFAELLQMTPDQQALELRSNVIAATDMGDIAKRALDGKKFGAPQRALDESGNPAFFQVADDGETRQIEGFTPPLQSGETLHIGPDGSVTMSRGANPPAVFTKSTTSKLEQEIISDTEILAQVRDMSSQFSPDFHTLSGRLDAAITSGKSRLDPESVSPQERMALNAFATYKATAAKLQSQVINQLSGSAVSPSEAKRLNGFLLDPGSGIFDGDDPVTAQAKIQNWERVTEQAVARKKWFLANGIEASDENFDAHPLDDMPRIIRDRHNEIVRELSAANPDMPAGELQAKAREQGMREFGLQ